MNVFYSARAQTFGLLKAKGLTFNPLKVRLLLFRERIFFLSSLLCGKERKSEFS